MAELLTNKKNFLKYGFCIVRNLFDEQEVKRYQYEINEICKKKGTKNAMDLYNYRNTWDYIVNDRLLNMLRNLLGSDIYYLHDMTIVNNSITKPNSYSWHRDNPCRITGKGPDWDRTQPYNVVSTITYLNSSEETGSGLSVIPLSHKNNYSHTISNILRIFHYRTKNIKLLKFIRDFIEKKISVIIRTDPGDCVIFLCNLFHAGLPSQISTRQTIQTRFGTKGKHSENFVNYTLKHRKESFYEINNNNKTTVDDFFNFLKKNNIYYPVPEKKKNIVAVKTPKYKEN